MKTKTKKTRKNILFTALYTLILSAILTPSTARADLTIFPIRVLMEGRDRSAEMTLFNNADTRNTYRLEWAHQRMKEAGGYEALDEPLDEVFDPNKHIRFSPRQVTIDPGKTQRIRLSLRKPADLPDGEYRGHLIMKKVASSERRSPSEKPGIAIQITPNVGFSIPVIVRQGSYDGDVTIGAPEFIPPRQPGTPPHLALTLYRTGIHSVNGHVHAYWTPPGEEERLVGQTKNVNVFHEIDKRDIGISLRDNNITSGSLRLTFTGANERKGLLYDEQIFPIGQ